MRHYLGIFPIDDIFCNFGDFNNWDADRTVWNSGRLGRNQSGFLSTKSLPVFEIRTKLNVPDAIATLTPLSVAISA